MKRAIALTLIIAACIVGFLTVRGTMPFVPVMGSSMEPTFSAGSLLLVDSVKSPETIEVGDIIVYNVPAPVQRVYNYPATVVHRVIKIEKNARGVFFRTKGDNTGEDPFTIRTQDLRGTVSREIPMLGFPLLFFQSKQGLIFTAIALSILAFYLYNGEVNRGRQIVHNKLFSPVIEQNKRTNWEITQRMETTEKAMQSTHQALNSFAEAMSEYAVHLKSHTSAIQGLSEASQDLRKGAGEQNRILSNLAQRLERAPARAEARHREIIVREKGKPLERITRPAGADQVIIEAPVSPRVEPVISQEPAHLQPVTVELSRSGEGIIAEPEREDYPPGCYQIRRGAPRKLSLAEKQNRILKQYDDKEDIVADTSGTLPIPQL
jgi:signal peptidase